MYNTFLITLFIIKILEIKAFLPNMLFVKPIFTDLENIVSQKAILSSIINSLRSEITIDKLFYQISNISYNHNLYIFTSFIIIYLYGQIKYFEAINKKNVKLRKINSYYYIEKVIKEVIIIFLLIFVKNVDPAI